MDFDPTAARAAHVLEHGHDMALYAERGEHPRIGNHQMLTRQLAIICSAQEMAAGTVATPAGHTPASWCAEAIAQLHENWGLYDDDPEWDHQRNRWTYSMTLTDGTEIDTTHRSVRVHPAYALG